VALLQRARFTTALAACGVGLAVCGVTLAVAGESPHPPADPLADLPGNIETVRNIPCDANGAAGAAGFGPMTCYHLVIVRSTSGETGTQLADRLVDHYNRRGFSFGLPGGFEPRQYTAKNACQTMLSITTNPMGGVIVGPNGVGIEPGALNGTTDSSLDPAAGPIEGDPAASTPDAANPAAGPVTTAPGVPPPSAGATGAATTAKPTAKPTAGATAARGLLGQAGPSTTVAPPAASSSVPSTAAGAPPGRTAGKSGKPGPATTGTTIRPGSQPGGEVILSAQVANTAGGFC
jgi:hypothetical protein